MVSLMTLRGAGTILQKNYNSVHSSFMLGSLSKTGYCCIASLVRDSNPSTLLSAKIFRIFSVILAHSACAANPNISTIAQMQPLIDFVHADWIRSQVACRVPLKINQMAGK